MKKYLFVFGLTLLMAGSYSCKSKKDNTATETTTTTTPSTAPVEISDDDKLEDGVDAVIKDFPGVDADVDDGVITLTGTIDRDRYMTLKQALDALRPKQVVNNLKYN